MTILTAGQWEEVRARRGAEIAEAVRVLPGSAAYDNLRPIGVPLRLDGAELLDFLEGMRTHLLREEWRAVVERGRLTCRGEVAREGRIVRAGERYVHLEVGIVEPEVARGIEILHEDEAIVVVNKPAPLPMHACGRFNRNTLGWILGVVYGEGALRPAHRLDADTSGVAVFGKTREVARELQGQFEGGEVRKVYLARVKGSVAGSTGCSPGVPAGEFECALAMAAGPGEGGAYVPAKAGEAGLASRTRFRVVRECGDGTTLLEVEPLSGRTNQIRAHLWSMGLPILGDPMYLADGKVAEDGRAKTLAVGAGPLCLHAWRIEFRHPGGHMGARERARFEAGRPAWAE